MLSTETGDSIKLKLYNNFWFKVETNNRDYLDALKEYFSSYVPGYFFMPKFRAGVWNGKLSIFDSVNKSLPYGLLIDFLKFHKKEYSEFSLEIDLELKAKFAGTKDIQWNWNLKYEPRYYQEDIVKKCIQHRSCLVESCTRSGKSLAISLLIKHLYENKLAKKFLLVVPRVDLVNQFKNDMIDYGMSANDIGCVWADEKDFDKLITISTWQSLQFIEERFKNEQLEEAKTLKAKRKVLKTFTSPFSVYDFIAIDEVHKSGTDGKLHWILQQCINATWRFGFTGTLPDDDLALWNVKSFIGPVVCSYKTEELRQKGYIANCVVNIITVHYKKKEFNGEEVSKESIFKLTKRINIIKEIVKKVPDKPIILLVDSIKKDGLFLEQAFKSDMEFMDRDIVFIRGSLKSSEREEWYEKCRQGKPIIMIAMYQIVQEGITINNLSDLVFASPCSSKIRILQSIGRTLATHYSKINAKIYDIVDIASGYKSGKNAGIIRQKFYISQQFDIKEIEI